MSSKHLLGFSQLRAAVIVPLFVFAFALPAIAQKDDEVITVDSSIVVMNASITNAVGKAVTGLDQKLFHIFEDGVEQAISSFSAEETPFAAVILIDSSGSMEERVAQARAAAMVFLDGLHADDNVAIFSFDSKVEMVQDFSNSRDIRDRAYDLKASGNTVLNDAIYKAAEVLSKRTEKRRAIIVLSDGADTASSKSVDKALKAALAINATVYTVDMGSSADVTAAHRQNKAVLRDLAEKTGGKFVETPGGTAVREAFGRIVEELGVLYTLTYQPANLKQDGKWRALELRVARPGLTIRTRKGYNAAKAN